MGSEAAGTRSVEALRAVLERGSEPDESDAAEAQRVDSDALQELLAYGVAAQGALSAVLTVFARRGDKVHKIAARVLCALEPRGTCEALVASLGEPATREAAVHALSALGQLWAGKQQLARKRGVTPDPVPLVELLGEGVAPALLGLLRAGPVRAELLHALSGLCARREGVFEAIEACKAHESEWVRHYAAVTLEPFGDRAVPALEALLRDFGEADRAAVSTLAKQGTPEALAALERFVQGAPGGLIESMAREALTMAARDGRAPARSGG